jgi:hypothetical protein
LGATNFKASPVVKTTSSAGAKKCIESIYLNHLVASYDHGWINCDCNSIASVIKSNPSATRGARKKKLKYLKLMCCAVSSKPYKY